MQGSLEARKGFFPYRRQGSQWFVSSDTKNTVDHRRPGWDRNRECKQRIAWETGEAIYSFSQIVCISMSRPITPRLSGTLRDSAHRRAIARVACSPALGDDGVRAMTVKLNEQQTSKLPRRALHQISTLRRCKSQSRSQRIRAGNRQEGKRPVLGP